MAETRLERLYGTAFPKNPNNGKQWRDWIDKRRSLQQSALSDKKLHWSRHRHFRAGRQWISTRDGKSWREPQADENRIRHVSNQVGPALDFRLTLLDEQRPGFRAEPVAGAGVAGRETAEAQQSVVEHLYNVQKVWRLARNAAKDAQTDGCSFLYVYVDRTQGPEFQEASLIGPEDERFAHLESQGYEKRGSKLLVPRDEEGQDLGPGEKGKMRKSGEIRTRILKAHECFADPEARTINGPWDPCKWFIVRRPRDINSARIETGNPKLEPEIQNFDMDDAGFNEVQPHAFAHQRALPPYPSSRSRLEAGVWEHIVFIARSSEFPQGKWVHLIGPHLIKQGDSLPGGLIPMARITDGSSDDDLFPRPGMSDWISDQMAINALASMAIQHARVWGGGRMLARKATTMSETLSTILGSVVEYEGQPPTELRAPNLSRDVWSLLDFFLTRLEDKTGWNDLARGQMGGGNEQGSQSFQDVSGRAVLGARELFERQFGPPIRAVANGLSDWAELIVAHAQHLYTAPRMIPMTGGRGDLAKRLSSKELSGPRSVFVDPETLMPLPRALRNQMLFEHLEKGLITVAEYRKRAPYAEIKNLQMGDVDHWERAQGINTVLEERVDQLELLGPLMAYHPSEGVAIFWQDDPEVHQRALEELILDERKPFSIRRLANDRWGIYDNLLKSKAFPAELELQGVPRPPAPLEVIGVPPGIPQAALPPGNSGAPEPQSGTLSSPAPETTPEGLPAAAVDQAAPLGVGSIEQALQQ